MLHETDGSRYCYYLPSTQHPVGEVRSKMTKGSVGCSFCAFCCSVCDNLSSVGHTSADCWQCGFNR